MLLIKTLLVVIVLAIALLAAPSTAAAPAYHPSHIDSRSNGR